MEWVYVILDQPPIYPTCHHTPTHYSSHPHHFIKQLHDHLLFSSSSSSSLSTDTFVETSSLSVPTHIKVKKKYNKHGIQSILQMLGCKSIQSITDDLFDQLYLHCNAPSSSSNQTYPLPIQTKINHDIPTFSQLTFFKFFYASIEKCHSSLFHSSSLHFDSQLAFRLKDRQQSITLLLGGSSGCGKSTLASLLGSRLSISTVLSTDNIRHLLRHFYSKETIPVLWTSSYYANTALTKEQLQPNPQDPIITGYEAQNDALFSKLDEIICWFEQRNESLILEGVHLSIPCIQKLMARHSTCVPFLIYISNEKKHKERFAVRSKYMTLEPNQNKYIQYFDNIRTIHQYLVEKAIEATIPLIDNSNVDNSLALIHRTVFNALTYPMQFPNVKNTNSIDILSHAFKNACQSFFPSASSFTAPHQVTSSGGLATSLID